MSSCGFSEVCSNSIVCLFYTLPSIVFCFQRRESETDAKNSLFLVSISHAIRYRFLYLFTMCFYRLPPVVLLTQNLTRPNGLVGVSPFRFEVKPLRDGSRTIFLTHKTIAFAIANNRRCYAVFLILIIAKIIANLNHDTTYKCMIET